MLNSAAEHQQQQKNSPWTPLKRTDKHGEERHELLLNTTEKFRTKEKVIFFGASSIEHWLTDGKSVWNKHYAPRHAYNYGVAGDMTQNMLWRIENGELDNITAKVVVFMPGSNNLWEKDSIADSKRGLEAVVEAIKKKIPGVKILLVAIIPRVNLTHEIHLLNQEFVKLYDDKTVYWIDFVPLLESKPGVQNTSLYINDHVHLNEKGYEIWYKQMEPLLAKLLEE